MKTSGKRADGYQIESLNNEFSLAFQMLIEYNEIPDEIPNPEEALQHPYKCIAPEILALEPGAYVLLLSSRGHSLCS